MSGFSTERSGSILRVTCLACGKHTAAPDKGMGRANIAAWKSRHQHRPSTDAGGVGGHVQAGGKA